LGRIKLIGGCVSLFTAFFKCSDLPHYISLVAALYRICSLKLIVWILFTVYFPVLVHKLLPVGKILIDVISSITLFV
jgi:hypothetical protein